MIFIPDSNLGAYVQSQVPEKKIHLWPGYCHVHNDISVEQIQKAKKAHPEALVMVHPECKMEIIDMADKVTSTEGMIRFALESKSHEFIVGTEEGLVHRLEKEVLGKIFHRLKTAICPNMKKITIDDVEKALEKKDEVITSLERDKEILRKRGLRCDTNLKKCEEDLVDAAGGPWWAYALGIAGGASLIIGSSMILAARLSD